MTTPHGLRRLEPLLSLPILELPSAQGQARFAKLLDELRAGAVLSGEAAETVRSIIDAVRRDGDQAVAGYMRQWTDPDFSSDRIRVSQDDLVKALRELDPEMRAVLETSIRHVRAYQQHIKPAAPADVAIGGASLGLRFSPVSSVGLAVPGGRAAYPSTVIMLAVPAMVAGVPADAIRVVTPPPTRRGGEPVADVSPLVLATCALLGLSHVYRIGGAQAMAALALGTATIDPVDLIVGPGNIYTQLAKAQLMGRVGIDGFYGPSEIVTIADESADADRVASDLIAQAEHDPGRCFLVAWSRGVVERIVDRVTAQTVGRQRRQAIEQSFKDWSAALLVRDEAHAVEVADTLAAEHVSLAVKDPRALLSKLRHGGEFFLGDATPVAAGDYIAGPSHCLPTATTARFASGISVYTFLKRSGTVAYLHGLPPAIADAIARLADGEGLDGHAASARKRV